jgi:hypothetical protein
MFSSVFFIPNTVDTTHVEHDVTSSPKENFQLIYRHREWQKDFIQMKRESRYLKKRKIIWQYNPS